MSSLCKSLCYFLISILFTLLAGCSSNFSDAVASFKMIRSIVNEQSISADYIRSLPYSSVMVSINDKPPVLMVLASAEWHVYKKLYTLTWLSSDRVAIITEHGRIIKTMGLIGDDLEQLASEQVVALTPGLSKNWSANYDWSPGYRYNFSAQVKTQYHGVESIHTELWEDEAEHISEEVNFDTLGAIFINHFWKIPQRDATQSFIVRSTQYIGPNMDKIEMIVMKPFLEPLVPPVQKGHN